MITTRHTSNIDEVIAEMRRGMVGDHVLEVRNTADYALYLQAKEGYSVLNDGVLGQAANERLGERLAERSRQGETLREADIVEALGEAAGATVGFYQSVIGTTDKPGKVKLPPRPVHPGQFASDSEVLVSSYESQVDEGSIKKYSNPF